MTPRRVLASLALLAAVAAGSLAPTADASTTSPAGSASSARAAAADPAHPYSDPEFYPVRQVMRMNCYRGNPGCKGVAGDHEDWQLVLVTSPNERGSRAVRAMGAGVFHFVRAGATCGRGDRTTLGTLIEIDHGGGIVSSYGHLATPVAALKSREGDYVAAGEYLGTMGTTGAQRHCGTPYLDFFVSRDGRPIEMPSLTVCVGAARGLARRVQQWPADQFGQYATWNDVPRFNRRRSSLYTEFPRPRLAHEVPDNTCLPSGSPVTPDQPGAPLLTRRAETVTVAWGAVDDVSRTAIEFQLYRPSIRAWHTVEWHYVEGGTTTASFAGIEHWQSARFALSHRNGSGWSRASAWATSEPS